MSRQIFGTDGVRGTANVFPITPEMVMRLGMAAGMRCQARTQGHRPLAVMAKDTRLSGYLLENALTAGLIAVGVDVVLVGPLPTPAVALLTRSLRADLGIMLSASHNPFQDNGIKFFGPDGYKLSDAEEADIETLLQDGAEIHYAAPDKLGKARRMEDATGRYIEYAKSTFPRGMRLDGLKVVVDCANGAAYQVAPKVLWELGAEVIALGVSPDGFNINRDCGSTHPRTLAEAVVLHGADVGIALDGDADRLIVVDELGQVVDGDQLMAMVVTQLQQQGLLRGGALVATVMSNMGLEEYVQGLGLQLLRTKVGDRYVMEVMREQGCNVGGEQSGHIILNDYTTTGDGLVAALQVLALLRLQGGKASEGTRLFAPYPQVLENIRYPQGQQPLEAESVRQAMAEAEALLQGNGRLLVRKSGTEPLIRVMVESRDEAVLRQALARVTDAIQALVAQAA